MNEITARHVFGVEAGLRGNRQRAEPKPYTHDTKCLPTGGGGCWKARRFYCLLLCSLKKMSEKQACTLWHLKVYMCTNFKNLCQVNYVDLLFQTLQTST